MNVASNFGFLKQHDPLLADLGATAERIFAHDPASAVLKLRLLAEALTEEIAARLGIAQQSTQADRLRAVDARMGLDPQVAQMFHLLRRTGNQAAHDPAHRIGYREGLDALRVARELAVWFHRSFGGDVDFNPGKFVLPDDPSRKLAELHEQVAKLEADLAAAQAAKGARDELTQLQAAQAEQERAMAQRAQEERELYEALAEEASRNYAELKRQFDAHMAASERQASADEVNTFARRSQIAAKKVHLDEAAARQIIDQQLRDAGWRVDSVEMTFARGVRPERGVNQAIAEWPTADGRADYMLFAGTTPVAAVEAKRQIINVAGKIGQAERYARALHADDGHAAAWTVEGRSDPWPDGQGGAFRVPFVYASNGRPLVKQSPELSGTWFRDARHPSHVARALQGFHTPEGLLDLLKRDKEAAEARLREEGLGYLHLWPHQDKAIEAVEAALADGATRALLAMATGTGKTRTVIGLMYRLLKAERFRRILFLVDRTALGDQAIAAFDEAPLEQSLPLSRIYNVAELGDMSAEAETRVQVATVQAMVRRIFGSDTPPAVDAYDCIIVDEAHRGYALDQEMTEGEQALRDQAQYLSAYRRALDYFDAVRIGLTATPAKHTTDIFGRPVYTYSYREAVADDCLIDHEPPIRYETLLSKKGIQFAKGEKVEAINLGTGEIESAELDDDLDFQVDSFNRRVINEDFNRVICEQLAREIDPLGEEKTLIFCATDAHADMVERLLHQAFGELYGEGYNQAAVKKITGASDKVKQLISRFKNETFPSIAITVDLLTTGIDVPAICHLVFLRRVRSRILYEQMIGRATRRCDAIGKTVFKIYDPVDLYASLEAVNTMRPLVKDPRVTIEQLLDELNNPDSLQAPGSAAGRTHAHEVLDQLNQKLMRVLRKATHSAEKRPRLKERLAQLQQQWGVPPDQLHQHLHKLGEAQGPKAAADFLRSNTRLLVQLAEVEELLGTAYMPILSQHSDVLQARDQSWGAYTRPEDYLDGFGRFIREQINQSAALAVVVQRPRDLTREQLKEVRLLLDEHGYSEANLKSAWRTKSNQDIAASILGYIRQAALGEALVPFEQRVTQAMQTIHAAHAWTPVQKGWLARLAKQLTHEVVLDHGFVNSAFVGHGGAKQLDKLLGGRLDNVMHDLAERIWPLAA